MHKSSELFQEEGQRSFVKGMTLDQYMSKNMVAAGRGGEDAQIDEEQNLYQSSGNPKMEGIKSKNSQYFIDEIDEESIQDSIQNYIDQQNPNPHKNQRTKETLVENAENSDNPWRARVNSISMNATAFFKTSNHDKNTFRIKHMSISPYKKKPETHFETGSITLYGSKFGQKPTKTTSKIPELVTFYGKLNHNSDQTYRKQVFNPHAFKKKESKHSFQKKNQLQLNQLIEFQSNIKNNYSHKNYLHQFKIEGIKDKFSERKNKFC